MPKLELENNGWHLFLEIKKLIMKDSIRQKLLLLIKHNGSITELIKDGFTYGQIASFINVLGEEEDLKDVNGKIVLSEKAENWLKEQSEIKPRKGSDKWILPEEKSRIEKIDRNYVYLPNRNELHF